MQKRTIPKRFAITLVVSLLFLAQVTAQEDEITACNIYNALCSVDLRSAIPGLKIDSIPTSNPIVYGKVPADADFKDVLYRKNRCDELNLPTTCENNSQLLHYSVYYPDSLNNKKIKYTSLSCTLPAIFIFHGGSYDECSDFTNDGGVTLCEELAKRGYIVFNIEYRRGVLVDRREVVAGIKNEYFAAQQMLAIYRASQDARGAIRSIILRQRNRSSFPVAQRDPFIFDTSKLFIGGISAGSLISMNVAYYPNQPMIDQIFPGVSAKLGNIEQNNFYYADTTVEFFDNLRGTLNCWGSVQVPLSYTFNQSSFFTQYSTAPKPQITFHGRKDSIFLQDSMFLYFSPNNVINGVNLNSESNCLVSGGTFTLPGLPENPDLLALGGRNIYKFLKTLGIPTQLYIDCEAEHGLDDGTPYRSNYGAASAIDKETTYAYIGGQAAVFFLSILKGEANLISGTTRFIECENYRHGCGAINLDDDDNTCDNDDTCTPLFINTY